MKYERKELDALADQILNMDPMDRSYVWEQLMKRLCGTCGDDTGGSTCWGCYESREYPDT